MLFLNDEDHAAMAKIVGGMKLSLLERLELFAEIERNYYGFRYTVGAYFPWGTAAEIAKTTEEGRRVGERARGSNRRVE